MSDGEVDELVRRSEAVERHAERDAAEATAAAWLRELRAAGESSVVWAALGRFCRGRLGVEPDVLVDAWGITAEGEVEGLLAGGYPQLKPPAAERVEGYVMRLCTIWGRRFGGT